MREDKSIQQQLRVYIQSPTAEGLENLTDRIFATHAIAKTEKLIVSYLEKMMNFVDRIPQLSTASMQNLVAIVFSHYF